MTPIQHRENKYLAKNASSRSYVLNVTTNGDTWSYDEVTVCE